MARRRRRSGSRRVAHARARDRMPALLRGPRARLPPRDRHGPRARGAERRVGALRLRHRGREPRRRRLRSVARQALGVRRDARGSADAHAGGAPRDRAARRRHEPRLPRGRARPSGVRGWIHPHRVPRRASRGVDPDGGRAPPRYRRRPGRARPRGSRRAPRRRRGRRTPRSPRRGRRSAPWRPGAGAR